MYILTKGQDFEKHGYILTIQFHYVDQINHLVNSNKKKTPQVQKTIVSINKVNNKKTIQVPLVKKPFVIIEKPVIHSYDR